MDGDYPANSPELLAQLQAIQNDVAIVNNHISPNTKKNLTDAFSKFDEIWSPRFAGAVNNVSVKLAKFEGEFIWHHHETEDEFFLVHKGTLLMKFRDREETIQEGEFIIVPHGVEHCPVALGGTCEVLLVEPNSTLNTGTVIDDRSVGELSCV